MSPDLTLVRGYFVPILRDMERAQISSERWEVFLATLPPDCPWCRVPGPDEWVSLASLHACNQAFVDWTGIEPRRMRGEVIADAMYGSLPLDPLRTPFEFFRDLHAFWEENARGLHMTVESLLPGEAHVRVEAQPPDPEWFPIAVAGWLRQAVALHGGSEVALEARPMEGGFRYLLRWN